VIERGLNAVWVIVGATGAKMAWDMGLMGTDGPDSGFFPFIASALMLVGGVALMLMPKHRAVDIDWPDRPGGLRVGGVCAGLAVIAFLLPIAGFALSGVLTMLILMKAVERATWTQAIILSVVSVAAVIGLFGKLLGMPLPRGPWGF